MKVYIACNRFQFLAAKVASYSFSRFGFETKIINVENYRQITKFFNRHYLKKGKKVIFRNDLQSFTFLRFLIPELFLNTDPILIIDPDMFAIKDPIGLTSLLNKDSDIFCSFVNNKPRTEIMLFKPFKKIWNFDLIINKVFNFELDYDDLFSLNFLEKINLDKIDNKYNVLDSIDDTSIILHTTQRITQPWKEGLKVDFQRHYSRKLIFLNYFKKIFFRKYNKKIISKTYLKHENIKVLKFINEIFLEALNKNVINKIELTDSVKKNFISSKFYNELLNQL